MFHRKSLPRPYLLLCAVLLVSAVAVGAAEPAELAAWRASTLSDVFVIREYRPGKLSFVESPARHAGVWTGVGYRHTLADLRGSGSIRHIWTTRADREPIFDWEFYVDGEATPSVRGTEADLIRAAERVAVSVAPANVVPLGNNDFNLFLPVPFDKSCRIEVVQRVPTFNLWFCQIDYRLADESMRGVRLVSQGRGPETALSYVGLGSRRLAAAASALPREPLALPAVELPPGAERVLLTDTGSGIVRELRLRWTAGGGLRLLVAYDGAETYAINSPIERFFGPFEGVSFYRQATNDASCYLPMPFRSGLRVVVRNEGTSTAQVAGTAEVERTSVWGEHWGYLHALHQRSATTDGHRLHQVLYVRGRGHWLGMSLYRTGHDHGGGDFAVIDGEGSMPAFLHGVNGEDYFTFAWFGKGAHHPYAIAHSNDDGRYRHHFENVYPFSRSIALEWGAFAGLNPESVAVWYQDVPQDTTLADGAREESVEWDVFGPVPIQSRAAGGEAGWSEGLPKVAELDAGRQFECRLVEERFVSGWRKEWSVGPMLNLTYLGRHGTKIEYEAELGGNGHAMLARRFLDWGRRETVPFLFAHDDPIELWVNGRCIHRAGQAFQGFETAVVQLPLRRGRNEVVVRLSNYFNRDFNWAGFLLRPLERGGAASRP